MRDGGAPGIVAAAARTRARRSAGYGCAVSGSSGSLRTGGAATATHASSPHMASFVTASRILRIDKHTASQNEMAGTGPAISTPPCARLWLQRGEIRRRVEHVVRIKLADHRRHQRRPGPGAVAMLHVVELTPD